MTRSAMRWASAPVALVALLVAGRADAQQSGYQRVAGCYAMEALGEAPWLNDVAPSMRLTLEPIVESDPGAGPQFRVESISGERSKYPYLAWSLYAEDRIVSVTWTSATDQVALVFEPDPEARQSAAIGTTTFFTHEMGATTAPVDVRVTAIAC